ncbi:LytTR family DNA-binding domain-containing protein [Flavobacterium piscis]|uniref:Two-component system LytT family response regulator n=1 Tax=Flavobacterium piscis TaxID=1114874 RepID=A0ABU1YB49_9FLAO|nr:LytTR family DNA-binding domain-containing protein [Flavobacterium piscis]MDR7211469.1 two-component system LytT family response regulator [Flavobacterium piscis]
MSLPKILIIEDENNIRKELEWLVSKRQEFNLLGSATCVKDAVKKIVQLKPDLVLMDIQLPDGNAFEVLNQIPDPSFSIIFITAFNHFAIKAIKHGAMDYLLKPVDEEELYNALDNYNRDNSFFTSKQLEIINEHQKNAKQQNSRICISTLESLEFLKVTNILYLSGDGSYTHFYLDGGNKIISSKPLKFYEELLPADSFVKCHQSYMVNTSSIVRYLKSGFIVLKSGVEIPVSTRKKEAVVRLLSQL